MLNDNQQIQANNQHDSLRLKDLYLQSFRNYHSLSLHDLQSLNIFIGQNAVGKTSIIEAIQLTTALKSFRTSRAQQFIQHGNTQAEIKADFFNQTRNLTMRLLIEEGKRHYFLNSKAKRIQDLKGLVPSVIFSPDDLSLIKGSNSLRLQTIDDIGTQLSKNFYMVKKDYSKLIRQKNKALKENQSDSILDSLDEVIVKVGVQYLSHRIYVINYILQFLKPYYEEISSSAEHVSISYIYSWDKDNEEQILSLNTDSPLSFEKELVQKQFFEALVHTREQERLRERCLIGPHADHLFFLLNNKNATHFASQGQQRTIVLAFKLSELSLLQHILHQKPLLLLDDVMSELDKLRREQFLSFINDDIQTFITTTNSGYFSDKILDSAKLYQLPFE